MSQSETIALNWHSLNYTKKTMGIREGLSREIESNFIEKLKQGDTAAFSALFLAYYQDLVHFACRLTSNKDVAEEIVQEAFVKLWEGREMLVVHVSLKSYMLKSVQNRCIDWHRHNKIRQNVNTAIKEESVLIYYDTDNYVLKSELEAKLDAALSMLPQEVEEAYRMNRFEGLKYHEIAEKLNVSVRTIEVRVGRALHLLREYLKDYLV